MDCIDLKKMFGDRFRIGIDESYFADTGSSTRSNRDPWLWLVLCKHGEVLPWGGDLLAVSTGKRGAIAGRLEKLDCTTIVQDGDDGVTFTFPLDCFDHVAEVVQPRRRRQFTTEQRKTMGARLALSRNETLSIAQ